MARSVFTSMTAFKAIVTRHLAIGIDELVLMRPGWMQEAGEASRQLTVMEQAAAEFPRLSKALTRDVVV